jgi:probable F420-dependent oxidoreductase
MHPHIDSPNRSLAPQSIGIWTGRLQRRPTNEAIETVNELSDLGYGAVWVPESPFGKDVLSFSAVLLGASVGITVATGIAIVWARDPVAMMNAGRTIGDAYPGRFALGIGISHESTAAARGHRYNRPAEYMRNYLQQMSAASFDGSDPVWTPPVLVAALGPRMLDIAAEFADGAHPFLTTPEHTQVVRNALGPDGILAVEQAVVVGDSDAGRALARDNLGRFLAWPNYQRHLLRLGFSEHDFSGGGSDRLVDALYAIGGEDAVLRRVRQQFDAGADHVCIQVVAEDDAAIDGVYRALAPVLIPR